jgi:hypothetical protein
MDVRSYKTSEVRQPVLCLEPTRRTTLDHVGKPPGLIEPFKSPNLDHEKEAEQHAAPQNATKIVYAVMAVVLVLLFLLVGIGLHIPAGG